MKYCSLYVEQPRTEQSKQLQSMDKHEQIHCIIIPITDGETHTISL